MYIAIGKIVQTHGIQGYVKAIAYSDYLDRFLQLKTLYIDEVNEMRGFILEDALLQHQASLLKFKGINNKEEAKHFVKKEIWLPESQKIELPNDEYFIHDIIGLEVFDDSENHIGIVSDVIFNAGSDIYVVKKGSKEILIPAVAQFIKSINISKQKMMVSLIDGMVD